MTAIITYVDGAPKLTVFRGGEPVVSVMLTDGALAQLVAEGAIILRYLTQARAA